MSATERFTALVQGPEETLALDEAALLLAAHAQPDLDVGAQLARLDDLGRRCDEPTVARLCRLLFDELALEGNRAHYDDPRNSFLNQVLDRRLGIPISLSVLTMEVGRRSGVDLEAVGMPGHFLVRPQGHSEVLIDPFSGGRSLDLAQAETLFHSLFGPGAPFSPVLLEPTGPRAILARMLSNLTHSYRQRRDSAALAWVARLRVAIPGRPAAERHELSRLFEDLGRFGEAARLLDELSTEETVGDELRNKLLVRSARLRSRLN